MSGTHPLLELDELSAVRAQPGHQRAARRAGLVPGVSGGSGICGGQGVCACARVCRLLMNEPPEKHLKHQHAQFSHAVELLS